ncbi:hypothetical protein [Clostridium manihotivorum]|uniref:DUF3021 family protein n=1 Tax=Clostridium manihotivorum TaxID=2320868 RepID=A0A3R5QWC4_9CLOT|nr:hypothetical protein [Clostridium manihotivorum]QAA31071.1 hypothetical protein C1I91_04995 [Clostridium manihotivorum]
MKRINQYILGGCIAFTVLNIITIFIHLLQHRQTIQTNSEVSTLSFIILIQIILFLMENLNIKSQFVHILIEVILSFVVTLGIGIPFNIISIHSISDLLEALFIVSITYGTTILTLYKTTKLDADMINLQIRNRN